MQVIQTYSYRIKDSSSRKHLCRMAGAVNFVWNYCNEVANEMWGRQRHRVTAFDLNNLTSSAAKELPINSQTIQAVAKEYVTRRNQFLNPHNLIFNCFDCPLNLGKVSAHHVQTNEH